jgi:hypothetical protein
MSGCYDRLNNRMTLYLFNHDNNNDFIHTAIHEYAHHLMPPSVVHQTEFWNCFFELLAIAEEKKVYSCDIEKSPELKKITAIIKQNDLLKNRKLIKKGFEGIFHIIPNLCYENEISFQYYTVKYLNMDWYKKKRERTG